MIGYTEEKATAVLLLPIQWLVCSVGVGALYGSAVTGH